MSGKSVRAAIDKAELAFRDASQTVEMLSHPKAETADADRLLRFQIGLVAAIHVLEQTYRAIKREEKRLIGGKGTYQEAWFRRRMKTLAAYTHAVAEALIVGRAIGDGFAWFFYERDRELVLRHLREQRQPLLPPDVGGQGERLTVENMRSVDGKLLLYHGITTFLRLGDVSLIDLGRMRVAAIGELKTTKVSDTEIRVESAFVATDPAHWSPQARVAPPAQPSTLPPAMQEKRSRQVKQMGEALRTARSDGPSLPLESEFYHAQLVDVVTRSNRRKFVFTKAGPGLVIGAYRFSKGPGSLSAALMSSQTKVEHLVAEAPEWAISICDPALPDNALLLGTLFDTQGGGVLTAEALPLCWWPIAPEVLRPILFHEVMVLTLYNPAHIYAALRERGFRLEVDGRSRLVTAKRRLGEREMVLEHFNFFHRLISDSLMTQESVLAMIDRTVAEAESAPKDGNVKMHVRPFVSRPPAVRSLSTRREQESIDYPEEAGEGASRLPPQ